MGIRSRLGVQKGIGHTELAPVENILRKITSIRLPSLKESISVDMLASEYLPYEASKTYRKIMIEFDCTRALTVVEAQRQLLRGS